MSVIPSLKSVMRMLDFGSGWVFYLGLWPYLLCFYPSLKNLKIMDIWLDTFSF
jgi:hypothetical protein